MDEQNQLEQAAQQTNRYSYLLRLWRTPQSSGLNWQVSLENPRTNERVGFANLEQMFAFLMRLIERDNQRALDQSKSKS